jgi:hypothetical protein
MKKNLPAFLAIVLSVCGVSCSRSSAPRASLPESWYKPALPAEEVEPSPEAKTAVRSVFKAESSILSSVTLPVPQPSWTLDGMIADFAVSMNGVFGALLGGGTASVKGTWQKTAAPHSLVLAKMPTARVNALTTSESLARQLEPAVRSAISTGAVHDESRLRSNLQRESEEFRRVCHALDSVPLAPGWHVDGFQLQLTFDASGNITPVLGAGGVFNLFLDWQKTDEDNSDTDPVLNQSVARLTRLVSSVIPQALSETQDIRSAGFTLDQFQLGLALSAQGEVGIAQDQGALTGKIVFKKDGEEGLADSPPDDSVSWIDRTHFEHGLKRALKMAAFFTSMASEADTASWRVNQIEAEFDASIGGEIRLATVNGTGQIVLDFDRIGG